MVSVAAVVCDCPEVVAGATVVGDVGAASGASFTTYAGGSDDVVVVPMIGPVPSPDTAWACCDAAMSAGPGANPTGTATPASSNDPMRDVSAASTNAATATGSGVVNAHLRDLREFPPEHTEKMPF